MYALSLYDNTASAALKISLEFVWGSGEINKK